MEETQEQEELRVKGYLEHPDFRHISRREWFGGRLNFYRREPKSPTGCELIGGCADTPQMRALIAKFDKRVYAGGMMGNAKVG